MRDELFAQYSGPWQLLNPVEFGSKARSDQERQMLECSSYQGVISRSALTILVGLQLVGCHPVTWQRLPTIAAKQRWSEG